MNENIRALKEAAMYNDPHTPPQVVMGSSAVNELNTLI